MKNLNIKESAYQYVDIELPIIPCSGKGKNPLLPEWQKHISTSKKELDSWIEKYKNINIGLPLGNNSLTVGIDVDGKEAYELLQEMSQGDLPPTWEFETPNGYRYLYKLPKDLSTKKKREVPEGGHGEVAILTQGQYTILPPSVLPSGKVYKWVENKDPNSIEIADAPKWILDLIVEKSQINRSNIGRKIGTTLGDIENIYKQCEWLKHCKEDSRNLSEQDWFNCLTVINSCKESEKHAIEYSKDYPNYNENEMLKKLNYIKDKDYSPVSCSNIQSNGGDYCLGCSLGVGSPATLGRNKTQDELKQVGFYYSKDGKLKGLNSNKFAAYLLTRIDLLYTKNGAFYMYKDNYWQYLDGNTISRYCRDILHEFVPNYWNSSVENGYIDALRRATLRIEQLDTDREKINLMNGTFDIGSYELKEHSKLFRNSTKLPIKYDEKAKCKQFMKFLEDIFDGDQERIKVTQEMFGKCLTADMSAQKAFLLYGRGANGKSMLAEILMEVVGVSNTSAVPLTELSNPFSRYELVGKLLNVVTENEVSEGGLNTTHFKGIVSGDAMQVEKKFEQGFMYKPMCKLVFCLNNLPYSRDKSWGFQRRLIIIPFNKTFKEDDPETQNYGELRQSLLAELDGIFMWALEGLKRLKDNKFKFSKSKEIEKALEAYKEEVNPYYNFAKDHLKQGNEDDKISNPTLSNMFREWATEEGHKGVAAASNQKIIGEIRNVLEDIDIDIIYGSNVKLGADRCTQKIKVRRAEILYAEEVG